MVKRWMGVWGNWGMKRWLDIREMNDPMEGKVEGLRNGRMMEKWVKGEKDEGKINRKIEIEWMNRFLIR